MRGKGSSRYERFSDIVEGLKIAAKELSAAVVLISQCGRPDKHTARKISLFDAKETGSIENSASHVIGINTLNREERTMQVLKCSDGGDGLNCRVHIDWGTMKLTDTGPSDRAQVDE